MSLRRFLDWTFNIIFWGVLALIISAYMLDMDSTIKSLSIALLGISGFIYYINAFFSPQLQYLINSVDSSEIYSDINKLFRAAPRITFSMVSYHYVNTGLKRSMSLRQSIRKNGEKKISSRIVQNFKFASWRDVSGAFQIRQSNGEQKNDINYIKLQLKYSINFANDGTKEDFINVRKKFKESSRKDAHCNYNEEFVVDDFTDTFMVQVNDEAPCGISSKYYVIWSIFTFHALYTMYVDRFCHEQEFVVRKLISTKRDLNKQEIAKELSSYDPKMLFKKKMILLGQDKPIIIPLLEKISEEPEIISQTPDMITPTTNVQENLPWTGVVEVAEQQNLGESQNLDSPHQSSDFSCLNVINSNNNSKQIYPDMPPIQTKTTTNEPSSFFRGASRNEMSEHPEPSLVQEEIKS